MVASAGEHRARLASSLREAGLDAAILSTPPAVTYASGYEVPLPGGYGTEVTEWLPTLALVTNDGSGVLLVPNDDLDAARSSTWLELQAFDSLGHFSPSRPLETWRDGLRGALKRAQLGGSTVRLGSEPTLPQAAAQIIAEVCSKARVDDVTAALRRARSIKTPWELERLRAAIRLADAAQRRLVELAPGAAGASDIEVWGEVVTAIHAAAARAVAVNGVLVTGAATGSVTGGPVGRRIEPGDPGLLDISPRLDGYWADCANTVVFGRPASTHQRRYITAAQRACEAAIDRLHPGTPCSEPALALRASLEETGLSMVHYAGHQIGTSVNETPRLLTFATDPIEAGMVFAVEAGAYGGSAFGVGARCEKVALVTESGPELLSAFDWESV